MDKKEENRRLYVKLFKFHDVRSGQSKLTGSLECSEKTNGKKLILLFLNFCRHQKYKTSEETCKILITRDSFSYFSCAELAVWTNIFPDNLVQMCKVCCKKHQNDFGSIAFISLVTG